MGLLSPTEGCDFDFYILSGGGPGAFCAAFVVAL